ncbi:KGGVGR-motif variant AAA ATPase [Nostoc sp. UHCC 0252]|uniref:KGGVGR-motif variant AAA ATPase n=1 Tax=Nostoc sp. UHCC 0252 TaxID=3110241 RepID=UPI002B1FF3BC|nr:hypothetical protein [Nostoc sp. UHCC 0252]MEA5604811.1 hypothetical protein [Nostoc sp. UHCC 0252]
MIYTFYSYKGGVGRSMALANIAELFYRANLKVLIIDWDLEAPGIERFFFTDIDEKRREEFYDKPGIIDMLLLYKQKMSQEIIDFNGINLLPFQNLEEIVFDVYPKSIEENTEGKLCILSAGKRPKGHFREYANAVINFDWKDFYKNWQGELYFEWLREQFERIADVVLIDSRTGVTEMGGVCTYQLADVVVMLCSANEQCLEGTQKMLLNLKKPEVKQNRERDLEVVVVPARLETSESDRLNKFQKQFLFKFFPEEKAEDPTNSFSQLAIPYVARYSYEETLAIREKDQYVAKFLVTPYFKLAVKIAHLAPSNSSVQKAKLYDPNIIWLVDSPTTENKDPINSWICIGGRDGEPVHSEKTNYSDKCDFCGLSRPEN